MQLVQWKEFWIDCAHINRALNTVKSDKSIQYVHWSLLSRQWAFTVGLSVHAYGFEIRQKHALLTANFDSRPLAIHKLPFTFLKLVTLNYLLTGLWPSHHFAWQLSTAAVENGVFRYWSVFYLCKVYRGDCLLSHLLYYSDFLLPYGCHRAFCWPRRS